MAYENAALGRSPDRPMSRIDNDVNTVKMMTSRIDSATERVMRYTRSLGYFTDTPTQTGTAPTPIVTSMSDALMEQDRAIDRLSSALNLFD